jgi:hypothetical protein
VVVFDQFEELFNFYPERWPEREQFFIQVREALAQDPYLRIVFLLREDYLAQLDPYTELLPGQFRHRFRMERLRKEPALAAVTGPLKYTNRYFAPGVAEALVDELLKVLVEDRRGQIVEVHGEFVEPVQLQVVCQSLWEELPPEAIEITQSHLLASGNVDQALARFYEKSLAHANPQGSLYQAWRLRGWFEQELITPINTRGLVYRGPEKTGGMPNRIVDILENYHIIRGERRVGTRWYELTHDRLIGPIQKSNAAWRLSTLKKWGTVAVGLVALVLIIFITAATTLSQTEVFNEFVVTITAAAQSTATAAAETVAEVEATATAKDLQVALAMATSTAAARSAAEVEATATAKAIEAEIAAATSTAAARAMLQVEATATAEAQATSTAEAQTLRKERVRPLVAGLSIGGLESTAGTLGYFAVGEQGRTFILSEADVLSGIPPTPGSLVVQPGPIDGGQAPYDVVGQVAKVLPREGPVPAANLVALAALTPGIEFQSEIPGIGPVRGIRAAEVGMPVQKFGRTTGLTSGTITGIDVTTDIEAGNEESVTIEDGISASLESAPGDGGALVVDNRGYAIGILISGSGEETILAPIQAVLDSYEVELVLGN